VLLLVKFVGIFREYVLKVALVRSIIFQLKMHQITFGGQAPSGPVPPDSIAGLREGYRKGDELGEGKGNGRLEGPSFCGS